MDWARLSPWRLPTLYWRHSREYQYLPRAGFTSLIAIRIRMCPSILCTCTHATLRYRQAAGTARALARAYGVFATGGRELGLRHSTLQALMAPAVPPARGFFDESLKYEWQLSLGFVKPSGGGLQFGSPSAFGMPGWGGALAYADPEVGAGYAYVTNRMGTAGADPREMALRTAFHRALERQPKAPALAGTVQPRQGGPHKEVLA